MVHKKGVEDRCCFQCCFSLLHPAQMTLASTAVTRRCTGIPTPEGSFAGFSPRCPQGCYQLPLHVWPPPRSERLRAGCLDAVPRVPCASLLVRLLTPEMHKLQRWGQVRAWLEEGRGGMLGCCDW